MECTQKLECTQDLYETHSQRICPDEIGFLGICGIKYPVKKGPNKVGRDPQTCNIILNLNSVSRQHAVINIISNSNHMIMDLDSANKTKLGGKSLQAYIPQPLRDGDTVQFGDVFGIFRLLEKDDELPMTQALDVPDTPMTNHHVSRVNKVPRTLVPESPDCSDMEDSYVVPSQDGDKSDPTSHFLKPSSKTIAIQPIGSKQIDNVYWNASKKSKSLSLSLNSSSTGLNTSYQTMVNRLSRADIDIHEMETQDTTLCKIDNFPSNLEAEKQMPKEVPDPSIHSQPTQMVANMPGVQKINTQHDMHINLFASNKNDDNLHDAETQLYNIEVPKVAGTPIKSTSESTGNTSNNKIGEHPSDEEIILDEINTQSFDEPFESQSIIPEDIIIPNPEENPVESTEVIKNDFEEKQGRNSTIPHKRASRVTSGDSTDCEDIEMALTQIVSENPKVSDDDLTDCEDVDNSATKKTADKTNDNPVDIEDLLTQVIEIDVPDKNEDPSKSKEENFEDLPTQVIVEDMAMQKSEVVANPIEDINNEDVPTQIINEDSPDELQSGQLQDQEYSQEIVNIFKIPSRVPVKAKRKEVSLVQSEVDAGDDECYYQSPQTILEYLCVQEPCIEGNNTVLNHKSNGRGRALSSVINRVIGCNIPHNEIPQNVRKNSSNNDNGDMKHNNHVSNYSKQKGLSVEKSSRTPSDSSDLESTPKKGKPLKFTDSDLPNSQEIKKSVNMTQKQVIDVYSSDSETENNARADKNPPLLYHKKKNKKIDAKLDLTKRFEPDDLPTRVITRVRKPTEKASKQSALILKPKFIPEQEDGIDTEIINENIARLKTRNEKPKTRDETSKPDHKEASKIVQKSNVTEKESSKHGRSTILKANKSKVDQKSTSQSSESNTSKLKKPNSNIDHKPTTRRTRSKNKVTNDTKQDKNQESPVNVKHKENSIKSDASLKLQEAGPSNFNLNATVGANQNSRTTRSSKIQTKSLSPQVKPKRNYRRRTKKTPDKEIDKSKTKENVTEGKRTRGNKNIEIKENYQAPVKPKSILKPSRYDESVIYNKSSESMAGSPNGLKRSANTDLSVPSPKRTRSTAEPIGSLRPPKIHYVVFTMLAAPEVQTKLNKLGAVTVNDVNKCTVLLTPEVRRSFKLLCAVGLGRPVVGLDWVQACGQTNTIVDPWKYIIKDEDAERRYRFDMRRTLMGKRNYLKGFTVSSTASVIPPEPEMKQIVKCSGGVWGEGGARWVVISTRRDEAKWPQLVQRGARVVSTEFVLEGVLRQITDVDNYLLV